VICDSGDVAVVPFPFSERPGTKRRPAVALSGGGFNQAGHTVFAMVTTKTHAPWPGDVTIEDLKVAGLPRPCIVRLKLFTLDNRLILRRAGKLAAEDRSAMRASLQKNVALSSSTS
jgi:mRNA interferase MazF